MINLEKKKWKLKIGIFNEQDQVMIIISTQERVVENSFSCVKD